MKRQKWEYRLSNTAVMLSVFYVAYRASIAVTPLLELGYKIILCVIISLWAGILHDRHLHKEERRHIGDEVDLRFSDFKNKHDGIF